MMCDAENDTPMLTVYTCATCRYVSVTPGRCRSHPYPMRGMGPPMVPVEVVPAAALEALRAERDRYREALERAADICEDAATMGCDCDGDYYKCGPCPSAIASRADDAVEVLRAALAAPAPKEDENEC